MLPALVAVGGLQGWCSTLFVPDRGGHDRDRAPRVMDAVGTGRSKEQLGCGTSPPSAHDQQCGARAALDKGRSGWSPHNDSTDGDLVAAKPGDAGGVIDGAACPTLKQVGHLRRHDDRGRRHRRRSRPARDDLKFGVAPRGLIGGPADRLLGARRTVEADNDRCMND